MCRRWSRVRFSEPALWRQFVLQAMPRPAAARKAGLFEYADSYSGSSADSDFWNEGSTAQLAAAFAARQRQLERTSHLVQEARLHYERSSFREQALERGGWQLADVVRALPAALGGLILDTRLDEQPGKREAAALLAASRDALARFTQLTSLEVRPPATPRACPHVWLHPPARGSTAGSSNCSCDLPCALFAA